MTKDQWIATRIIKNGIVNSMHEENVAVTNYTKRMKYAESKGDLKTARLYKHIIGQEVEHFKEFKNRKIQS